MEKNKMLNYFKNKILRNAIKFIIKEKKDIASTPQIDEFERNHQLRGIEAFESFSYSLEKESFKESVSIDNLESFFWWTLVIDPQLEEKIKNPEFYIHVIQKIEKEPELIKQWLNSYENIKTLREYLKLIKERYKNGTSYYLFILDYFYRHEDCFEDWDIWKQN